MFYIKQLPPKKFISNYLSLRALNDVEMRSLTETFAERAKEGLQSSIKEGKGPLMLRSFVSPPETDLGSLEGKMAIGIDIGGTNLRMGVGKIHNEKIEPTSNIKPKEIKIKYASLDDFFQMLLNNGLEEILKENPDLPLACIFSFPGTGLKTENGVDMIIQGNMTKGWQIGGSEEKNLGEELNKFLEGKRIKKRKYFIVNDTVTLIKDGKTNAGIVCASGYNWAIKIATKLLGNNQEKTEKTIIDTEAGSAITAPKIPVITDSLLKSIEAVPLRDEYRVSGKYLGKTLGLTIEEIKKNYPKLFKSTRNTYFPKSFVISDVLDGKWNYVKKWFGSKVNFSIEEKDILMQIATALRDSSAQIVAGHLIALNEVANLGDDTGQINISSDGPIIQKMPEWKDVFTDTIKKLSYGQLSTNIQETVYQGDQRDFRSIFDVMYQAIEFFARENK
ncbi:MAG TPA: hypothetical protein VF385_01380 [Patescibacteria group bacterium]